MTRLTLPLLALVIATGGCGSPEAKRIEATEKQVRSLVAPLPAEVSNMRLGFSSPEAADFSQRPVCGEVRFGDPVNKTRDSRNFVSITANDVIMDPRVDPAAACQPHQTGKCVPPEIMKNMLAAQANFDDAWKSHCAIDAAPEGRA